jgi:hypothetical protein
VSVVKKELVDGVAMAVACPATDYAFSIVICLGITGAESGAPGLGVIAEFADRLAIYCGCEVVAFSPHGLGDSEGSLSFHSLVWDMERALDWADRPVVLVGYGVVAGACVAVGSTSESVRGIAVVDPAVSKMAVEEEVSRPGIRFDGEPLDFVFDDNVLQGLAMPVLVVTKNLSNLEEGLLEVHKLSPQDVDLMYDPRVYAVLLGWLERKNFGSS